VDDGRNLKKKKKKLKNGISGRRISTPAAAGSSPSIPFLVFRPRAVPFDVRAGFPPCAQRLWCELYCMKDLHKKKKNVDAGAILERCAQLLWCELYDMKG